MLRLLKWVTVVVLSLFVLVLSAELVVQFWPDVSLVGIAQGKNTDVPKKTIVTLQDSYRDAVQVIHVTENGQPIRFGKRFATGDDWITNLSFGPKNEISMKIAWVWVWVQFPEASHYTFPVSLGEIPEIAKATDFGHHPREVIPRGTGHSLGFAPGQEITVSLSPYADATKMKIEAKIPFSKRPFSNVTMCKIVVAKVCFEDKGMIWDNFGSGYAIPDRNSERGYRRLPGYFPR
jgi:hypothetical protein